MKSGLLERLKGGDLRSIGRANEAAQLVLKKPELFQELFGGMTDGDPLIRMRAADAAEKVSSKHPEYLQPFKARLLNKVAMVPQQEVRWHTAQMLAYLTLTPKERDRTARLLFSWIENEKSNIVKVLSLQALAGFAQQDKYLRSKVVSLLNKFVADGSPSLKSRSKKILKEFAARKPGKT